MNKLLVSFVGGLATPLLLVGMFAAPSHVDAADIYIYQDSDIASSTPWVSGNTYVINGGIDVNSGVTLNIQAGATVKFQPYTYLTVHGTLNASGTQSSPIYFTSIKDDVRGDTNGDNDQTTPALRDWYMIRAEAGGSVNVEHAYFRYGGRYISDYQEYMVGNVGGALNIASSTLDSGPQEGVLILSTAGTTTVSASHFEDGYYGVFMTGGGVEVATSTFKDTNNAGIYNTGAGALEVTGSNFDGNYHGVQVEGSGSLTMIGNVFTASVNSPAYINLGNGASFLSSDNKASGSGKNGFVIVGSPNASMAMLGDTMPYLINGTFTIGESNTLNIYNGAIIKFLTGTSKIVVDGTLNMLGTKDANIFLTSIEDDLKGGDTNNDGNSSTPWNNEWGCIEVNSGGSATINHSVIRYGGNCNDSALVYNNGGSLAVSTSTIAYSNSTGVLASAGTTTIKASDIAYHYHGIYKSGGVVSATPNNMIHDNEAYGIYNEATGVIDARNNNWGTSTGPIHSDNPSGTANRVSDNVNFDPWNHYDHYLSLPNETSVDNGEIRYTASTTFDNELASAVTTWNDRGLIGIQQVTYFPDLRIVDIPASEGADEVFSGNWSYDEDDADSLSLNRYYLDNSTYDQRQNTITHELGHALGLNHSYLGNIMVFYRTNRVQLGPQDVSDYEERW